MSIVTAIFRTFANRTMVCLTGQASASTKICIQLHLPLVKSGRNEPIRFLFIHFRDISCSNPFTAIRAEYSAVILRKVYATVDNSRVCSAPFPTKALPALPLKSTSQRAFGRHAQVAPILYRDILRITGCCRSIWIVRSYHKPPIAINIVWLFYNIPHTPCRNATQETFLLSKSAYE